MSEEDNDKNRFKVWLDKSVFLTADSMNYKFVWVSVNDKMEEIEHAGGYYATIADALLGYVKKRCRGETPENIQQLTDFMSQLEANIRRAAAEIKQGLTLANSRPDSNPGVNTMIGKAPTVKKIIRKTKRAI
jgi:hypothetical protein